MALEAKQVESEVSIVNESKLPMVSWGAIFCGAFMVIAVMLLFTLLGSGIGLSAFNIQSGEAPGEGALIGTGIYTLIAMLVSFFVGGYAASRLAGLRIRMPSLLHSLSVWAFITSVFAFGIGSGVGSILSGTLRVAGVNAPEILRSTSVNQSQSSGTVHLNVGGKKAQIDKNKVQAQAKEMAGKVQNAVKAGSWWAFFTFLLSAFSALLGGVVGNRAHDAIRSARTRHIDRRAA